MPLEAGKSLVIELINWVLREGVKSDDLGAILRGLSERLIAHGVPLCRTNLPSWAIAEPLRSGALRRVLAGREPPPSTIYVVYPGNRLMSMKVRAFVDHLARHFGRTPTGKRALRIASPHLHHRRRGRAESKRRQQ